MSGRAATASTAVAELDDAAPHWMCALDADLVVRGRAWAKVAAGELSAAIAPLSEGAASAGMTDHRPAEARLLHDIARLGQPASVVDRLTELVALVDGEMVAAFAAHAAALATSCRTGLAGAAATFEDLGALLLAAEAGAEAALACRRDGIARQASMWDGQVERLREQLGDVRTPALTVGTHVPLLTRREREVAELAARGATSKEIAARLFVSVRTVDNHLQRAYAKLRLSRRDQLESALGLIP